MNFDYRVEKLMDVYKRHGNIVIGVDFDYTLVDSSSAYELYTPLASFLRRAQALGLVLCVWTANQDEELVRSKWEEAGLKVVHYNSSPLSPHEGKQHFNLLLDDTAGLFEATRILVEILKQVGELR